MAETLKASEAGIEQVAQAGFRRGWTKTRTPAWWTAAHTSQATLRRFWRRLPIAKETFINICQAVGINHWEAIVQLTPNPILQLPQDIQQGKRTLAAIVFTDAVNFSKKMDINEEHTLALIDRDLQMMTAVSQKFEGQVLKSTGDGLLIYFSSAIQAVGCALEIQKNLGNLAAEISPEDILSHRIGIHLGDVFFSEKDVMGNGVNIAARLQAVAAPGGICISQTVYDVVKSSIALKANYLGPQELKNISEAVPVYQILLTSQKARQERNATPSNTIQSLESPPKQDSGTLPKKQEDWGDAPDISNFYGRVEELEQLEKWVLQDGCKVIAIFGMGGMGKTSLAVALADKIQEKVDCLIWRSLKPCPSINTLVKDLLEFLSQGQETLKSDEIHAGISRLIESLRQRHCLIILDEAEAIFGNSDSQVAAGKCREGYEGYAELLQRIGNERHQSCLLLTSREKPSEVATLEGKTLPVRSLQLRGLKKGDGLELFKAKGFSGSEKGLTELIQLYGGSPLALKVIMTMIQEVFSGNISDFLGQNTVVLGDRLRYILKEQVSRLSTLEKDVVYWLALLKKSVSLDELRATFLLPPTLSQLVEVIASLERRSLIDKTTEAGLVTFTLQPMVMKYVAEELIAQIMDEIDAAVETQEMKPFKLLKKYAFVQAKSQNSDPWVLTRLNNNLQMNFGGDIGASLLAMVPLLSGKSPTILGYLGQNLRAIIQGLGIEINPDDWKDIAM